MKKLFALYLVTLSFNAFCQEYECPDADDPNYACGNIEEEIISNLPDTNFVFPTKVQINLQNSLRNKKRHRKAVRVVALIDSVFNDPDFWKAIQYYDKYQFPMWSDSLHHKWRSLTGEEIIFALLNGDPEDTSFPETVEYKIRIKLYGPPIATFFESAIGRDGGNGVIENKRWFFRKNSISSIGSNWAHEISHSRGMRHCYNCNEERDYSIPYVINRIFAEVAERYIDSI